MSAHYGEAHSGCEKRQGRHCANELMLVGRPDKQPPATTHLLEHKQLLRLFSG